MKLSDFTGPEIRHYLADCNFTKDEQTLFIKGVEGSTNEMIAEEMNVSVSTVKRIKKRVISKISKIDLFST